MVMRYAKILHTDNHFLTPKFAKVEGGGKFVVRNILLVGVRK